MKIPKNLEDLVYGNDLEMKKCKDDPSYFIFHYCKSAHLAAMLYEYSFHFYQQQQIDVIHNDRTILLSSYAASATGTTTLFYALWEILFHEGKNVFFIEESQQFFNIATALLKHLPTWMTSSIILISGPSSISPNNQILSIHSKSPASASNSSIIFPNDPKQLDYQKASLIIFNRFESISEYAEYYNKAILIAADPSTKIVFYQVAQRVGFFTKFADWAKVNPSIITLLESYWYDNPSVDKQQIIKSISQTYFTDFYTFIGV